MQLRQIFIFFSFAFIISGCDKSGIDSILVEGVLRDDASGEPIAGMSISIDAIKSSSGMGIISGGKREHVGKAETDRKGYYKAKLKVFEGAERLQFYLNPGMLKEGYVEIRPDVYLSDINIRGRNKIDFTVNPTALLNIRFRNVAPVSDSDVFFFSWTQHGRGWTRGILQKEHCGTVLPSEAFTWTGKDVCGSFMVESIAERYTTVFWTVTENGIQTHYRDSIFMKRGAVSEFLLNY